MSRTEQHKCNRYGCCMAPAKGHEYCSLLCALVEQELKRSEFLYMNVGTPGALGVCDAVAGLTDALTALRVSTAGLNVELREAGFTRAEQRKLRHMMNDYAREQS